MCLQKKISDFFSVILVDWKEASPNICRAFARARIEVYIPHREMFYTDSEGQVKVRNAEVLKRQQYGIHEELAHTLEEQTSPFYSHH